jgi:RNA polymerase sigma-70 factor (ECF subfamily)
MARLRLEALTDKLRGKLDASDIVQATLLKAHQARDLFRGQSEVEWRACLRKVMANTLADELSRLARGKQDEFQEQSLHHAVEQSCCQLEALGGLLSAIRLRFLPGLTGLPPGL